METYKVDLYDNGNKRCETYYKNDKYHRIDGPAIIWYNENGSLSHEEYYVNDNFYEDILEWMIEVGCLKGE